MDLCYINGHEEDLDLIDEMEWNEFKIKAIINAPIKLFKYFPYTCYSLKALKNNTVYMQNSENYNDPYDSMLSVDYTIFFTERLKYYLKLLKIKFNSNDDFYKLNYNLALYIYDKIDNDMKGFIRNKNPLNFSYDGISEECKLRIELFQTNTTTYIYNQFPNFIDENKLYFNAINHALQEEVKEVFLQIRRTIRCACFTTTNDNLLMWSHYADSHKGFCIEYEITNYNLENCSLYNNLYPVIYTNNIKYVTYEVLKEYSGFRDDSTLWGMYRKGLLGKSIDWKYENEWRLTLPYSKTDEIFDETFFSINKIYLGSKMPEESKKEIIKLCKSKYIQWRCMKINPLKYSMKECEQSCENCNNYIDSTK